MLLFIFLKRKFHLLNIINFYVLFIIKSLHLLYTIIMYFVYVAFNILDEIFILYGITNNKNINYNLSYSFIFYFFKILYI